MQPSNVTDVLLLGFVVILLFICIFLFLLLLINLGNHRIRTLILTITPELKTLAGSGTAGTASGTGNIFFYSSFHANLLYKTDVLNSFCCVLFVVLFFCFFGFIVDLM